MPSEEISHLFTYLIDFTYLEKQQACESEEEKFKYNFYQEPHPGLMEEMEGLTSSFDQMM